MKSNRWRKIVYAILAVAVIFSVTVSDMLIFLPEGAHAQKSLVGKITYEGNDNNISLVNVDRSRLQRIGEGLAPVPPPRPPFDAPWSPNVQVNDDAGGVSQASPDIAVDPFGNAYAVWVDHRRGNLDIYFSYRPAGGHWGANVRLNDDESTVDQYDPVIAVDLSGNAYAVWQDNRNGTADIYNGDIYFSYRPAEGNWGTNVRVNDDAGTSNQWFPAITVDSSGNAYAVWMDQRNGNYDIYFSYRPAGGSWGTNVRVNDDVGTAEQWFPAIAVDSSGNAYAVWQDYRNGNPDIYFSYRPAGGTWEPNVRVNDDGTTAGHMNPAIGVDPSGNAYAVWQDGRADPNCALDSLSHYNCDADIYFSYRPRGGTWGANVKLSDDRGTAWQGMPAIAVDASGNAHAVWDDLREGNQFSDIYFSHRPAGGSWGTSSKVNDDPGINTSLEVRVMRGPAITVDASGNAYAVWTDHRNGGGDIYFSYRPPVQPAQEPPQGEIAYVGTDGNIWLMNADGSEQRRLTNKSTVDILAVPSWCPDGERIVYENRSDENASCHVVDANGNYLGPVPTGAGYCDGPACFGQKIAFASDRSPQAGRSGTCCSEIYVVDIVSGEETRITHGHHDWFPDWSPDGTKIVYWSTFREGEEPHGVYVVNADGSADRTLVPTGAAGYPAWSPAGDKIAFWQDQPVDAIYVVNTDGTGLAAVPNTQGGGWHRPAWSSDGKTIAFARADGVYVVSVDGSGLRKIADGSQPTWQPIPRVDLPRCGAWHGTTSDQRIRLTRISEASRDDCHGAFLFSNRTGIWGLGGYTLELQIQRSENASGVWMTLPEKSPPLLPSLDLELHTFPVDRYSKAQISVEGSMTLTSVATDTALFVLKTALAFVPGRACVVPDEQLAYAVIRVSHIVAPVAQLAFEGDLVRAKQELQQLLPEFFSRSSAALKEIGLDCGAEFLEAIIGQPAVIVRLGVAYMTWVPVAIMDYFKYQGRPAYASLMYEVSPADSDQADLAITDLYPYYGDRPQTVEGSPIATVFATVKNNGPGTLTNVSVWMSCSSEAKRVDGTTSTTITKEGKEIISLLPGQHEDFNTWQFVHSARGFWFIVTCSIAFPNDLNPGNNVYTERLP